MRDDRKRIRRAAKVTPQTSIATAIRSQNKRICTENNNQESNGSSIETTNNKLLP